MLVRGPMKIHGVEASALEAGGTKEVWTIPEPQTCEFKKDDLKKFKEDDFHYFNSIFVHFFLILMSLK